MSELKLNLEIDRKRLQTWRSGVSMETIRSGHGEVIGRNIEPICQKVFKSLLETSRW